MLGYFGRHWRGEGNFWIGMLAVSLVGTWALVLMAMSWLGGFTMTHTPYANITAAASVGALVAIFGVWQVVGTWRASAKARAPQRWLVTRWGARLVALAGLALAVMCLVNLPGGMARYYAEANDLDPIGQEPHDVSIEGDRVVVTGHMSWGLYDAFVQALNDNAQLTTVVLNSPGGHYGVGLKMAEQIKSHGLDTVTTEMCGSACTYAFLGGNNRHVQKGAKLGYHAPYGNTAVVIANVTEHARGVLRAADVPDDFIAQVFATPGDTVWYPTIKELRQANIVTE